MTDMLVKLYALPDLAPVLAEQKTSGVGIRQAHPEEKRQIADWAREHINPNWAKGCEVALEQRPLAPRLLKKTRRTHRPQTRTIYRRTSCSDSRCTRRSLKECSVQSACAKTVRIAASARRLC